MSIFKDLVIELIEMDDQGDVYEAWGGCDCCGSGCSATDRFNCWLNRARKAVEDEQGKSE